MSTRNGLDCLGSTLPNSRPELRLSHLGRAIWASLALQRASLTPVLGRLAGQEPGQWPSWYNFVHIMYYRTLEFKALF